MSPLLLRTTENPNGLAMDDLLKQLIEELDDKTDGILPHTMVAKSVIANNVAISRLLKKALDFQMASDALLANSKDAP